MTLLSRDTQYRKILNEDELVKALKENTEYRVKKVTDLINRQISRIVVDICDKNIIFAGSLQ